MLGGLFESSFGSKCKLLLNVILMRVEMVQKKRRATENILKTDLADLLATQLELDAYKRAGRLLAELRVSSGYDFIEDSCNWLLRHISSVRRRKECPEKCKEAVASLMFAAAWFSDLPELRDLRDLFHSRYGKNMEFYVNQKFAESLKNKQYSDEKKLRLMEHVAAEFSETWNSASFKKRISRDLVSPVERDQLKKKGSIDAPYKRKEPIKPDKRLRKGHGPTEGKEKPIISRATWYSLLHRDKKISVSYNKFGAAQEKLDKRENIRPKRKTHYLVGEQRKKEYVSPSDINSTFHLSRDAHPLDDKLQHGKLKTPVQECQCCYKKVVLPDMRRVREQQRRGLLDTEENRDTKLDTPTVVERKVRGSMISGRTLRISIQEVNEDEEEKVLDNLLIKYSINLHSPEKLRVESKDQPSNKTSSDARIEDGRKLALAPITIRTRSHPNEQIARAKQERAIVRVSSGQPSGLAPHVHPKLPDCDDLVAKFAALKQQQQQGS